MSIIAEQSEAAPPPARLHNSGWGRPPEQYRTPGIGAGLVINLLRLAESWPRFEGTKQAMEQLPAPLLSVLGAGRGPMPILGSQQVEQLRDLARERGWLEGVILTCAQLTTPAGNLSNYPTPQPVDDRDMTLAILAVACSHPPAVIWDAPPAWRVRLRNGTFSVRWLRRSLASPAAHEAWTALTRAIGGSQ